MRGKIKVVELGTGVVVREINFEGSERRLDVRPWAYSGTWIWTASLWMTTT